MLTYHCRKLNCVRIIMTSPSLVSKWPHALCRIEKFLSGIAQFQSSVCGKAALLPMLSFSLRLLFLSSWCKYDNSQWELLLLWFSGNFSKRVSSSSFHFKRCSWGSFSSNRLLFSPTLWDIWDPPSACCAVLCLQRALFPDCGLSHLHGYTENKPETWPHVRQSRKLLQYLVAKTDKLSFSGWLYTMSPGWKRRLREALGISLLMFHYFLLYWHV